MTIDFGVFIGRFQPLHVGHEHVIAHALQRVNRLIVLVGSANVARDPRNPFIFAEREAMLRSAFRREVTEGRLIIAPLEDHLYSDTAWVTQVQRKVRAIVLDHGNNHGFQTHGYSDFRIALTGYGKEASSFYLKLFPEWENLQIDSQYGTFSSSDVRARYFQRIPEVPATILSAGVTEFLRGFMLGETFRGLLEEAEFLAAYPAQWGRGPFVTTDAVVVQSGHIHQASLGQPWLEKTLWGLRDQEAGWIGAEVANSNGSYDLGPLQINTWWAARIATLIGRPEAHVRHWLRFDPCFNAEAARWVFLTTLRSTDNYWKAVGAYHSPTMWRQQNYAASVAEHLSSRFGKAVFGP